MLMPILPPSFAELLAWLRPCFTAPTFATFTALCCGFLAQTGRRTVTGMLLGARLSQVWSHHRAHRFFSRACWSADQLGLHLTDLIVRLLINPDAPIPVAVDDTLLRRRGRKIHGAAWHHDPLAAGRQRTAWGHCWVVAGILVDLPFVPHRAMCLPVLARLWRPKTPASKPALARELVDLLADRFGDRRLHLVGDAGYATRAFAGLDPRRVTVTVRPRGDAALYELPPPRTGRPGRPRVKGARLGSIAELADDPATSWQPATVTRYGQHTTVDLASRTCLWYGTFGRQPVRLVLVRERPAARCYDLALITTDLHATDAELVERYAARWNIEVTFEDARQLTGAGEARNRTRRAVERTIPFELVCFSLAIAWYAHAGQPAADLARHRTLAPWYTAKHAVSVADMLAALRRTSSPPNIGRLGSSPPLPHKPWRSRQPGPPPDYERRKPRCCVVGLGGLEPGTSS
jgi:DDE superfamily endonuclease